MKIKYVTITIDSEPSSKRGIIKDKLLELLLIDNAEGILSIKDVSKFKMVYEYKLELKIDLDKFVALA